MGEFEMALVGAAWTWDDGAPCPSQWRAMAPLESRQVAGGGSHLQLVGPRGGRLLHRLLVDDEESGMRLYQRDETKVLVRRIRAGVLLSVHAEHQPEWGLLRHADGMNIVGRM